MPSALNVCPKPTFHLVSGGCILYRPFQLPSLQRRWSGQRQRIRHVCEHQTRLSTHHLPQPGAAYRRRLRTEKIHPGTIDRYCKVLGYQRHRRGSPSLLADRIAQNQGTERRLRVRCVGFDRTPGCRPRGRDPSRPAVANSYLDRRPTHQTTDH